MTTLLYLAWLGIGLALLLVLLLGRTRNANLIFFAGILFVSGLATPLSLSDVVEQTFWLPVQSRRSELFLAFGLMGTAALLLQSRRANRVDLSLASTFYFLSLLYAALLRGYHEGAIVLFESTVFCVFTVIPLALWSSNYVQSPNNLAIIQRVILLVNILTIGFVAVQFVQDSSMLTLGNANRFRGLLSNPQHAGVQFALFSASALWIMLHDKARYFTVALAVLAVNGVLLLWSGSRTSMAMFLLAGGVIAYPRLGRQAIYLPLFALIGFGVYSIVTTKLGVDIQTDRLAAGGNTRSEAWRMLIRQGVNNPLTGVGVVDSEKSENGWLYGFATYGIGMLAIQLIWTAAAIREILVLVRRRNRFAPEIRPTAYYCIGILLAYFGGAVFEGYLISRVSTPMCIAFLAFTLTLLIRKTADVGSVQPSKKTTTYPHASYGT